MHGGLIKSPGTVRAGQTFSVTISKSESTSVNSWVGLYRRSANIKAGCRSASECFAWNYLNDTGPDNYSAPGSATVPAQAFIDANGEFTVTLTAPDGSIGGFPLGEYELRTYLHGTDYSFPQAVSPLQIVP